MAYAPIALTMPQYEDYANWYLKAYTQGTTTPLSMATDSGGGTTLAKSEIDANGFPTTDGSARFIPYINGAYDLWMFPTSADADANDTTNAIQLADNINADPASAITVTTVSYADNVSALIAIDGTVESRVSMSGYHSAGDSGGGEFYWDASQDKANHNGGTIIDPDITFPSDWTNQTQVAAWFTASTGTGCWVRTGYEQVSVKSFGAKGDGVTDDTAALVALAAATTSNTVIQFEPNATYLVSRLGFTDFTNAQGNSVFNFTSLSGIHIVGNNCTFKIVNHDISTYGGLKVFNFIDCGNKTIEGVNFNLTYIGKNDSAAYYPDCGAIVDRVSNDAEGTPINNTRYKNINILTYHPFGQFSLSTNAYLGGSDFNNGYKNYGIYVRGAWNTASNPKKRSSGLVFDNIRFLDGHNGYGLWNWAVDSCVVKNCIAESWVAKVGSTTGTFQAAGVPMIRYTQFSAVGFEVTGCLYKAKPSEERLVIGMEGGSYFVGVTSNNIGAGYTEGSVHIHHNQIYCGFGDAANSLLDYSIQVNTYGQYNEHDNYFYANNSTSNKYTSLRCTSLNYTLIAGGSITGQATAHIKNNVYADSLADHKKITLRNGSTTSAANRLCKSLHVTDNVCLGSKVAFLDAVNSEPFTYDGAETVLLKGNVVKGDSGTPIPDALVIRATEASDVIIIDNNVFSDTTNILDDAGTLAEIIYGDNRVGSATLGFSVSTLFTPVVSDASGNNATGSFAGSYIKRNGLIHVEFALLNISTAGMVSGDRLRMSGFGDAFNGVTNSRITSPITTNTVTYTGTPLAIVTDGDDFIEFFDEISGGTSNYIIVSDLTTGVSDIRGYISFPV